MRAAPSAPRNVQSTLSEAARGRKGGGELIALRNLHSNVIDELIQSQATRPSICNCNATHLHSLRASARWTR